jgi:hypothetical protein
MPVLSWAHSHFWSTQTPATPDPPLGASAGGAYVPWQTSIITTMSLAMAVPWSMSR